MDVVIATWVEDQALAAIRAVLPDLVIEHGVLAMGQLQDATAAGALAKANGVLVGYGVQISTFAQLNVNLPDDDAQQLKQLAAAKAYATVAGDFSAGVRGQAILEMAHGVEAGNVGAQQAIITAGFMGASVAPGASPGPAPAGPVPSPPAAPTSGGSAHFCAQCGTALPDGAHFCPSCGTPAVAAGAA
jgi:hypothetical protein